MPLQATSGAASYDAFGGGVAVVPNYIEDVFSTWLYTGNGTSQTITNGVDLAGKGGMLWIKQRSQARDNYIWDTVRGSNKLLSSNTTAAQVTDGVMSGFTSTGFSVDDAIGKTNASGQTYASWTFRKQPKFFDVVTYTGNGANRTIAHILGSTPGCIIIKRTDTAGDWQVYHNGLTSAAYGIQLNLTNAQASDTTLWNSTAPTSTVFSLGTNATVNASGGTYVAYLFAHNAGGFGLSGTDNVISCGSYTGTGSTPLEVNLGFEAQWVLIKRADGAVSWYMGDVMRGLANTSSGANTLQPNTSNAEQNTDFVYPTATGFAVNSTFSGFNASGGTYIYIAIRRGPMKVPTDGTKVFSPVAYSGDNSSNRVLSTPNFPVSLMIGMARNQIQRHYFWDRLRGSSVVVDSTSTDAEFSSGTVLKLDNNTGPVVSYGGTSYNNQSGYDYVAECFQRAPGFFDEVCYTGTGTTSRNNSHNLAAVPELMIVKERNFGGTNWRVYSSVLGNTKEVYLNQTNASTTTTSWASTTPTSSVFTVGVSGGAGPNDSGSTYVAYLFATCAGVSKVGSYTGTGTTQTINCGFTGGARFVLIKKTSGTGSWYVWDSSRGIVAGNDPYLLLNSTAAEVTNTDYVDTASVGFEISSTAPSEINENGGSFIFLAIA